MTVIWNLTQYPATPAQLAAGVVNLPAGAREEVVSLLMFDHRPDWREVEERARLITLAVPRSEEGTLVFAMLGGPPFLLSALEWMLHRASITPVYAFTHLETLEENQAHGGFVAVGP